MAFGNDTFIQGRVGLQPQIIRYNVLHSDLVAAATTEVEDLFTLPIGWGIIGVTSHVNTAFSGGTVAAMTVQVGVTGGDTDRWYSATDVFTGCVTDNSEVKATAGLGSASATTLVSALFTSTTGDCADCTAGDVDLYFVVAPLDLIATSTKGA